MHALRAGLLVFTVALAGITVSTVARAEQTGGNGTVTGPGVLDGDGNRTLIATWQRTTVELDGRPQDARDVCLRVNTSTQSASLTCQHVLDTGDSNTIAIPPDAWPANTSGRATLVVTTVAANGSVQSRTTQPLFLFLPDVDRDDDGLVNRVERKLGTIPFVADSDRDGLDDGAEYRTYGTDPNATDTDGDGLADGVEVNRYGTNPKRSDTDGDGLDDGTEVTTYGTKPTDRDTDGDGLADGTEVTDYRTNPTASDTDHDGLTDGPEVNVYGTNPLRQDTDGDGLRDGAEVNQYGTNPTDRDTDGDGFADGAEVDRYGTDPTRANAAVNGEPEPRRTTPGSAVSFPLPFWMPVSASVVLAGLLLVGFVAGVCAVLWWGSRDPAQVPPQRGDAGPDGASESVPDDLATDSSSHPDAWQVHRLLADNGGRLPQSEIVERTDWSKSKVSRVLSAMAEDDQIRKIQLGRENLVARPGDEPDSARGPFEDDESM